MRTGTAMAGTNLSYEIWAIATYLLATRGKRHVSMKLHRDLGISRKAAWFLAHRLREAWEYGRAVLAESAADEEANKDGSQDDQDTSLAGREVDWGLTT